ncbi:polymeric immunoglobulin receptor-like [Leptodactylus fuscus]|uniref:polymeric immunoglobulin receptor-like n=1 Tax=Leptodactylus fuscus TaxID=238119 RepID=UPI003F4E6544
MILAVFLLGIAFALIQNVESDALVCPNHVIGQVGGEIRITCSYSTFTKANQFSRKFLCKEGWLTRCKFVIVSTSGYEDDKYAGRVSIEDNKGGTIIITMSNLQTSDGGTYICGMGPNDIGIKAIFTVIITEDSVIPKEATLIYGSLKGSVKFKCEFGDQYATEKKYFCKIKPKECKPIIDSSGVIDYEYHGKIILQGIEGKPASFTVTMIQLENRDSGMFSCGVGSPGGEGESIEFDLRINLETNIQQGPKLLKTELGGSVTAVCKYNPKQNYTLKFWCRWNEFVCDPLINTDGFVESKYEGILAMYDDSTNGIMQVIRNRMTKEDEGWYWFVLNDGKLDQTFAVQIRIGEGYPEGLTADKTIHVKTGETAKITCTYPCRFNSHEKYWCQWNNHNCQNVPFSSDDDESVSCQPQKLTLSIPSVSQKHNGWYWCGVKKNGLHEDTVAVQLVVEDPFIVRPNSDNNARAAKVPSDGTADTPPSVTENKHNSLVAGILSVCAAVLVISAVFFIIRLRRKKNSDLVSVGSYTTNISMTDLDNVTGKENPAVIDTQETDISSFKDGAKSKKKGSQEDLDYSSFLIHNVGSPNEENTA